jgi:hypothetical protein
VANDRNLIPELNDPSAVAWSALETLLNLGGRLQRSGSTMTYCAPGIHASWASTDDDQAFRQGVRLDTIWAVVAPAANVYASPSENSKVIAVAGHELVAVVEANAWSAPNANDTWVKVRWDRSDGYTQRRNVLGPNDPGLCLERQNDSWVLTYFRARSQE